MLVASFCTLPVGIFPWTALEPMLTVVVKATYMLTAEGEAPLAVVQEPLSLDVPEPLGDAASLRIASDFVPKKGFADVLLVGHAKSTTPVQQIESRLVVDVFDKSFVGLSGSPVCEIPLVARQLRASGAPGAPPIVLGPRAAWERQASCRASEDEIATARFPEEFDFSYFNYAPADQRLGLLRPNPAITLMGLLDGAPVRRAWLPGARPRVFAFGARGPGTAPPKLQMVADTLWIDADRALCTLTFRGVLLLSRLPEAPTTLVVAVEKRGASRGWASIAPHVDRAAQSRAIEASDLRDEDSVLDATRPVRVPSTSATSPGDEDDEMVATQTHDPRPRKPRARMAATTQPLDEDSLTSTLRISSSGVGRSGDVPLEDPDTARDPVTRPLPAVQPMRPVFVSPTATPAAEEDGPSTDRPKRA